MTLSDSTAALRLDDGPRNVRDHALRRVDDVAGPQCERMPAPSSTSMMSRTWPSGLGPGSAGSVRQVAAAARIAAIWSSSQRSWGGLGLRQRRGALHRVTRHPHPTQREPEEQVEQRAGLLARECEILAWDLRKHSTRRVVLQAQLVAVALLGRQRARLHTASW